MLEREGIPEAFSGQIQRAAPGTFYLCLSISVLWEARMQLDKGTQGTSTLQGP